jgi:hypothetical protein
MDLIGAAYLTNPSDRQAAATTMAQVVELESSLDKLASDLSEGFTEVLKVHAAWLRLSLGGAIEFSGNVIKDQGRDSQMLMAMGNLPERDLLSKQTFLEWLVRNEFIWEDFDVQQELERIGEDVKLKKVTNIIAEPA